MGSWMSNKWGRSSPRAFVQPIVYDDPPTPAKVTELEARILTSAGYSVSPERVLPSHDLSDPYCVVVSRLPESGKVVERVCKNCGRDYGTCTPNPDWRKTLDETDRRITDQDAAQEKRIPRLSPSPRQAFEPSPSGLGAVIGPVLSTWRAPRG